MVGDQRLNLADIETAWKHDQQFPLSAHLDEERKAFVAEYADGRIETRDWDTAQKHPFIVASPQVSIAAVGVLLEAVHKLEKAVQFYADKASWEEIKVQLGLVEEPVDSYIPAHEDEGQLARRVLAQVRGTLPMKECVTVHKNIDKH